MQEVKFNSEILDKKMLEDNQVKNVEFYLEKISILGLFVTIFHREDEVVYVIGSYDLSRCKSFNDVIVGLVKAVLTENVTPMIYKRLDDYQVASLFRCGEIANLQERDKPGWQPTRRMSSF